MPQYMLYLDADDLSRATMQQRYCSSNFLLFPVVYSLTRAMLFHWLFSSSFPFNRSVPDERLLEIGVLVRDRENGAKSVHEHRDGVLLLLPATAVPHGRIRHLPLYASFAITLLFFFLSLLLPVVCFGFWFGCSWSVVSSFPFLSNYRFLTVEFKSAPTAICLQIYFKPYQRSEQNELELLSLLSSFTVFFASQFLFSSIPPIAKTICSVFIVTVFTAFVVYAVYQFISLFHFAPWTAVQTRVKHSLLGKTLAYLMRCYCCCCCHDYRQQKRRSSRANRRQRTLTSSSSLGAMTRKGSSGVELADLTSASSSSSSYSSSPASASASSSSLSSSFAATAAASSATELKTAEEDKVKQQQQDTTQDEGEVFEDMSSSDEEDVEEAEGMRKLESVASGAHRVRLTAGMFFVCFRIQLPVCCLSAALCLVSSSLSSVFSWFV